MKRPLVRYHGGKWRIAPWIISHFPQHRVYVEPFGGGGSVLLRKPRCYAEIYNDLDGEIVNLFKIARDSGDELARLIEMTPFARDEFNESYLETDDPIEMARRTIIRAEMSYGSVGATRGAKSGFVGGIGTNIHPDRALSWVSKPDAISSAMSRLQGVIIENHPALDVIRSRDCADALIYVDPPYVASTRTGSGGKEYRHEMTDDDHQELADCLKDVQGFVILSGYPSELYEELYRGWNFVDRLALIDKSQSRIERLWFNERAWANRPQQSMFSEDAS